MAEGLTRFYDGRVGAGFVVDLPLLPRDLRGVVITDASGEGGCCGDGQRQETRKCAHENWMKGYARYLVRKTQY
jgi:hypothetical protein